MTPFMAAFVTIVVPMILWLFTLSEARSLAKARLLAEFKSEPHQGRGGRVAIFLLTYWPFLLMPFVLPWCIYRLIAAELPLSSWFNIALMVFGPAPLLWWMFRTNAKA